MRDTRWVFIGCAGDLTPDDMMTHMGRKYYVALMSAGSYYGASHQAPMIGGVIARIVMSFYKGRKYVLTT